MITAVGYIPTPAGDTALEAAIERAALNGSALHLINVVRGDRPGDLRHASDAQLADAAKRANARGVTVTHARTHVETGDQLVESLLTAVDASNAQVLVIGGRRERGRPAHMLGMTLQHIVADSPCCVLVV
ncbi:MAG: universal stress protein [Dermabacter sp.]|nr:universal stress protein [Dermabacter sp.]